MMTTAPRTWSAVRSRSAGGTVVRCLVSALVVSALLVAVVAVAAGGAAATSSAVGAGIGLAVMAFGSTTLNAVAGVMPGMSLAVALMTYTLQVVVTIALLLGLTRSGALDGDLERRWVGVAMIVAVIVWMVAHVVAVVTARLPVYDLDRRSAGGGAR